VADVRIYAEVSDEGSLELRRRGTNELYAASAKVGFDGLEAELVRLFERWLAVRSRVWEEDELRAFGTLLHRILFTPATWAAVQAQLDAAEARDERLRLELVFPFDSPYTRLAAIPWEYLYAPDTAVRQGFFLATHQRLVLSRYVPTGAAAPAAVEGPLRVLVVTSAPDDLGEVLWEPALESITAAGAEQGFVVEHLEDPNAATLFTRLADRARRVDVLHFVGHGEFDPDKGSAKLALTAKDDFSSWAEWVGDRALGELVTRAKPHPRAVVLQACEGGKADEKVSFAGLAPQLVRSGVSCAVAMQFPVTNRVANEFTRWLYGEVAKRQDIDDAVQEARFAIGRLSEKPDPFLFGLPVTYLAHRRALATVAPVPEVQGP
jgi:hypothetical protein